MDQQNRVRYAVVGLGYIAQGAVLPAFRHASESSVLTALVSDDARKLKQLGKKYGVARTCSYDSYDALFHSGDVDAVYIALPNSMHHDFARRAAEAKVHVLTEKPMAVNVRQCEQMIDSCRDNGVKLMVAYRLHFEEANLKTIADIHEGKIGMPRMFNSIFSMRVREGNIRTREELGGGALFDIGIYCINAARYLFRREPKSVMGHITPVTAPHLQKVDALTTAILDFGEGQVATFSASFDGDDVSTFHIVGTKGNIRLSPAYEYSEDLLRYISINGRETKQRFKKRDQFAALLTEFSKCIRENREPEPSGEEGLADLRIIEAIFESAKKGVAIKLPPYEKRARPDISQEMHFSSVSSPRLVHAEQPSAS